MPAETHQLSDPVDAAALEAHQQLEPDLDGLLVPEQDPAFGRDQLVRPGEVWRVGLDAEELGLDQLEHLGEIDHSEAPR